MWSTRSFAISGGIFTLYAFAGALSQVDSVLPGLLLAVVSIIGAVLDVALMGLVPFVLVAVVLHFVTPWKGTELASKGAIVASYPIVLLNLMRALLNSVRTGTTGGHWLAGLVAGIAVAVVLWMLPTWRSGSAEAQAEDNVQEDRVD